VKGVLALLMMIVEPSLTVSPLNWMSGVLVPTHPIYKFNNSGDYDNG